MVNNPIQPDPSFIMRGIAKTPFVLRQEPVQLFTTRAERFRFLAQSSDLATYLVFLADLTELQATLAEQLPAPALPTTEQLAQADQAGMPLLDRTRLAEDASLHACLQALCQGAVALAMPEPARQALDALLQASHEDRSWLLANVLADTIPEDSVAVHVFAAAAVQVHLARQAYALPEAALKPVSTGVCPACGGRPATSSVLGLRDIDNVRYATCNCCATQWNEVRIKCLCCGSTKGITYRSADTADATVKAEVCNECSHWVKVLYQVRNASLEPLADDVGSMGLDILMKNETEFKKGGFNPFIVGY